MNAFLWLAVVLLVLAVVAGALVILASMDPEGRAANVAAWAFVAAVVLLVASAAALVYGLWFYRPAGAPSSSSAHTLSAATSSAENSTSEK